MFSLSPLLKGLRIEQVVTRLKEEQQLKLDEKGRAPGQRRFTRTVVEDNFRRSFDLAHLIVVSHAAILDLEAVSKW